MTPSPRWSLLALAVLAASCECDKDTPPTTKPVTSAAVTSTGPPGMPPRRSDVAPKCRVVCQITGRCSYDRETQTCSAASDADCRQSRSCKVNGMCTAEQGVCIGTSDEDCAQAQRCKKEGLCKLGPSAVSTCVAKTDEDCADSEVCREQGRCTAIDNRCDDPENPIKPPKPSEEIPPP